MATEIFLTYTVFCAFLAITAECQASRCATNTRCSFQFCEPGTRKSPTGPVTITLSGPKEAAPPYICGSLQGKVVGNVKKTGEALVSIDNTPPEPISKWEPRGLSRRFSKKYFRLFNIPNFGTVQGVGRLKSKGNQEDFLDGLCVTLPVKSYDLLNSDGRLFTTINKKKPDANECVSFRTETAGLVSDGIWNTTDDLDLEVKLGTRTLSVPRRDSKCRVPVSPGSAVCKKPLNSGRMSFISRFGNITTFSDVNTSGRMDTVQAECENGDYERFVINAQTLQPGRYTAILKHANNCAGERIGWTLRVQLGNGKTKKKSGTADIPKVPVQNRIIAEVPFRVKKKKKKKKD